jgi:hypothetical protein
MVTGHCQTLQRLDNSIPARPAAGVQALLAAMVKAANNGGSKAWKALQQLLQ